jgi:hypothetical protein
MEPLFVLVHSPSVGPATWAPVARELARQGRGVVVPSLAGTGEVGPPFWPRVTSAVADALAGVPADRTVVLAGHSNAGLFLPIVAKAVRRSVQALIFVDATVPADHGETPVADTTFVNFLHDLTGPDGRLPRWTEWWGEADVAPLFPDERTRATVTAEQPRLPLAYYQQTIPVPDGWTGQPCRYLRFSDGYAEAARQARKRGWPVRHLPGEHLHQLVDPYGTAEALVALSSPG